MSAIEILDAGQENGSFHVTLKVGKIELFVMLWKASEIMLKSGTKFKGSDRINVLQLNSAHYAYRGMGRYFDSWSEALAAYKSGNMKSGIEFAQVQIDEMAQAN